MMIEMMMKPTANPTDQMNPLNLADYFTMTLFQVMHSRLFMKFLFVVLWKNITKVHNAARLLELKTKTRDLPLWAVSMRLCPSVGLQSILSL